MKSKLIAALMLFFAITGCEKTQTLQEDQSVNPEKQKEVEALDLNLNPQCLLLPTEITFGDRMHKFLYVKKTNLPKKITISTSGVVNRIIQFQYNKFLKLTRVNIEDGSGVLHHFYKYYYNGLAYSKTELYSGNGTLVGEVKITFNPNGTIDQYEPPYGSAYDTEDKIYLDFWNVTSKNLQGLDEVFPVDWQSYQFDNYDNKNGIFRNVKYIDWVFSQVFRRGPNLDFPIFNNRNNFLSQRYWLNNNHVFDSSYVLNYNRCGYPVNGVITTVEKNLAFEPAEIISTEQVNISIKYQTVF
ncbi:hypothetical protein C3K47_03110 [Solitalea longa]|uniref:Uncharacterized protein n=1 Tax=Solitalea longa TaxID=2079460 RepID=A0A2S5A8H2_9SPHI|nr:hypothetical protein [Solitalea longa]POY38403.1 hypothetical protein C3K47_03110 [Solitalea longa]